MEVPSVCQYPVWFYPILGAIVVKDVVSHISPTINHTSQKPANPRVTAGNSSHSQGRHKDEAFSCLCGGHST